MKTRLTVLSIFTIILSFSQSNTEVYLFDLVYTKDSISIINPINISNNKGYDSQPYFVNNDQLLFASERDGLTDIASFFISSKKLNYKTKTTIGGEYSPQRVINSKSYSAVRLDTTGLQRLYEYRGQQIKRVIEDLKVAYYTWYDLNTVISAVIETNGLSLYISDLMQKKNKKITELVGRSFHRIPNSNLISFVSKENQSKWQIKSINPKTGETKFITNTIQNAEDLCWLNDGSILMSYKNQIFICHPSKNKGWQILKTFKELKFQNITRLAVNPSNNKLALVSEMTPEHIVQQQLDTYNARDIEGFSKVFSEDIKIYEFPNTLLYDGKAAMKARYNKLFEDTPDLNSTIQSRIVQGNTIIDHEYITANGKNFTIVAIYEVEDGLITKATFIR